MDPQTCAGCHPAHYTEWSGSMHAYASEDPLFRAMNARGQRETDGELGDFCVSCHAPLAVREGETVDGLNLDEVSEELQGVTCFFCHSIDGLEGDHNAQVRLADDGVLRGSILDPVENPAHTSVYSPFQDRNTPESSALCGTCHDIVTPNGTHIERTYTEWQESLYASQDGDFKLTCNSCHMEGRDDVAASVPGVPVRRVHDHSMPGVDLALTPWPGMDVQRQLVQDELDTTVQATLCVQTAGDLALAGVTLENVAAGHSFPSGSSPDRRAWVELKAYDAKGNLAYQSGVVQPGQALVDVADPDLWSLNNELVDENGEHVHMFWEAHGLLDRGLYAPPLGSSIDDTSTHQTGQYVFADFEPSRVTMAVHIRPLRLDFVDDLISSGHLDPGIRDLIPTLTLGGTVLEWTPETASYTVGDLSCVK